jgi:hypothetical protein
VGALNEKVADRVVRPVFGLGTTVVSEEHLVLAPL